MTTSGPSPVIRAYLLQDTVDSTASAIRALNPGAWYTDGDVPRYMYTSLCTLWTGSSGNTALFDKLVVANSGAGKVRTKTIAINPIISESEDSQGLAQMDALGAENAKVLIAFQLPKAPTDKEFGMIDDCEARVRMLIDANLRPRSGRSQSLPIPDDAGLEQSIFLCSWCAFANDPNEADLVSEYTITYIRSFGRSIIP